MNSIVTGSLGNISKPLATELVQQGHAVTVISSQPAKQADIEALGTRAAIGSLEDADFLARTFAGADAVYAMVPPTLPRPICAPTFGASPGTTRRPLSRRAWGAWCSSAAGGRPRPRHRQHPGSARCRTNSGGAARHCPYARTPRYFLHQLLWVPGHGNDKKCRLPRGQLRGQLPQCAGASAGYCRCRGSRVDYPHRYRPHRATLPATNARPTKLPRY